MRANKKEECSYENAAIDLYLLIFHEYIKIFENNKKGEIEKFFDDFYVGKVRVNLHPDVDINSGNPSPAESVDTF